MVMKFVEQFYFPITRNYSICSFELNKSNRGDSQDAVCYFEIKHSQLCGGHVSVCVYAFNLNQILGISLASGWDPGNLMERKE